MSEILMSAGMWAKRGAEKQAGIDFDCVSTAINQGDDGTRATDGRRGYKRRIPRDGEEQGEVQ